MALIQIKPRFVRPPRPTMVRANTHNPLSKRLAFLCVEPVAGKLRNQVISQRHPGATSYSHQPSHRYLTSISGEVERKTGYWSHLESREDGFESAVGVGSMLQPPSTIIEDTFAVCIRNLLYVSQGSGLNTITEYDSVMGYNSSEKPFPIWADGSSNQPSGPAAADSDEWHVWVQRGGPNGRKFWADGVLEADLSAPGASTGASLETFDVGGKTSRNMTGDIMWVAAWGGEVPDHLCKELSRFESGLIWSLFPGTARMVKSTAAAGGVTIMNQLQGSNMGADLYNGTLL